MNFGYSYSVGPEYISANSFATTVLIVYFIGLIIVGLISAAIYILRGIGFYTIAKAEGDENPWLAFVPIARIYQQGSLAGDLLLKEKVIKKAGIWLTVLPIAWGILSYVIGVIAGIVFAGAAMQYEMMSYYGGFGTLFGGAFLALIIYIVICSVYNIIYRVLLILVNTSIYSKFTTGNMPMIHSIFSAFIPLYEAVCVFVLSRKIAGKRAEPTMEYQQNLDYRMVQEQTIEHTYEQPAAEETEE